MLGSKNSETHIRKESYGHRHGSSWLEGNPLMAQNSENNSFSMNDALSRTDEFSDFKVRDGSLRLQVS